MANREKAHLAALIESTEDLVWSVDLDGRIVLFNNALSENIRGTFRISLEAGMRIEDVLPPERAAKWPGFYRRALAEGPFRVEYPLMNGRVLEMSLNPIVVEGVKAGVSIFGKDITNWKNAEKSLRETIDLLRQSQIVGALGSYVLDIPAGRWTGSGVLDDICGTGKDYDRSVEGWAALVHPADHDMMLRYYLDEVVQMGRSFDKEYRIVRPSDGAERWVHGIGELDFDDKGNPATLRGVIKDITDRKHADIQLRESEQRYRATFEQAAVGILHVALDGRILRSNPRFAQISGYSVAELTTMSFRHITPPEYLEESNRIHNHLFSGAPGIPRWEKPYIRKDGSLTWVRLTGSIQRDTEGLPLHAIILVEDINAQKEAEKNLADAQQALRASEQRYRTVFQTTIDSVSISHLSDGRFIDVNKQFLEVIGYSREEIIGHSSLELGIWNDPRDRENLVEILRQNRISRDYETRFKRKNGEVFWVQCSTTVIEIEGVPCMLGVMRDITGAKSAADTIHDLAFYDPLTHLPNRRLLLDRLQQNIAAGIRNPRKNALLLVDLDDFKTLNDTMGHEAGDSLLQEVARRLVDCVREVDTVARFGGDEFVVMLEDLSQATEEAAAQAKQIAEKIFAAVARPYLLDNRECHSPCSIGITVFGTHLDTSSEILQQAELAMYQAKAAGRNAIHFFAPALQAAVNARAALEDDLRRAIKSQQFVLYYQPQVQHGRLIGAETLLRWNHPRRGLLDPAEFISVAEETGLIVSLGMWGLEVACRQLGAWAQRSDAADIILSVNISARQFSEPDFVEQVLDVLKTTGANPKNLELELTESLLVHNIDDVVARMNELNAAGIRFALDDFGTGYSSLSYLKRLPLNQLKIDRTFVKDILVDVASAAIAQTIISLGKAMGLSVIAEGVETEEQLECLASFGCNAFQGFLFSPPVPLEEFDHAWIHPTRTYAKFRR